MSDWKILTDNTPVACSDRVDAYVSRAGELSDRDVVEAVSYRMREWMRQRTQGFDVLASNEIDCIRGILDALAE